MLASDRLLPYPWAHMHFLFGFVMDFWEGIKVLPKKELHWRFWVHHKP